MVTSMLSRPLVNSAMQLAQHWCDGRTISEGPAIAHAVRVARVIDDHLGEPPEQLTAACLLHDAPYLAPDDVDVDAVLTDRFGEEVTQIVNAIHVDFQPSTPGNSVEAWKLYAKAADKIVAIGEVLLRSRRASNTGQFWATRRAFIDELPAAREFAEHARPHLPPTMAGELLRLIGSAERATAAH